MSVEMLYFTAAWCAPCRGMAAPIAELQADGYQIRKIDVDKERNLANQYGVQAMPTFVVLRDGEVVIRSVGAKPKAVLQEMFKQAGYDG